MADLFPTHECFNDAFELINEIILNNPLDKDDLKHELILVHAICKMPEGRFYAHAWVEDKKKNTCMFKGILEGEADYFAADIKEYYEHIMPQEIVKYSVMEAIEQNIKSGNLGPWKSHIKALCRNITIK
jgi:hypothetical protein